MILEDTEILYFQVVHQIRALSLEYNRPIGDGLMDEGGELMDKEFLGFSDESSEGLPIWSCPSVLGLPKQLTSIQDSFVPWGSGFAAGDVRRGYLFIHTMLGWLYLRQISIWCLYSCVCGAQRHNYPEVQVY